MIVEHTTTEDNSDDERIEAEVRQQVENVEVPVSLPDKAVCVQIHTGNVWFQNYTSLLWQSIVVFATELDGTSLTTVSQSPKFVVTSICDLPDVINCQFREFAASLLGPVHFLSLDQQSGILCLIICVIQLLTPNNLGSTWRRVCLLDIRSVNALEVLRNRTLQIDIYLLTYLHSLTDCSVVLFWLSNDFTLLNCWICLHGVLD